MVRRMRHFGALATWVAGGLLALGLMAETAVAQDSSPSSHFSVGDPAALDDAGAEAVYQRLSGDLRKGYRLSGDPVARAYQGWTRVNSAPYRSATHGERFVNNFVNGIGRAYGRFEQAGTLPAGSIVAKDSFAVTLAGEVTAGPLFVMEKMPAGFNPASRDWRYSMIMPDGSLFGVTGGTDSNKVGFCITCHAQAGAARDHLFFLPEDYR